MYVLAAKKVSTCPTFYLYSRPIRRVPYIQLLHIENKTFQPKLNGQLQYNANTALSPNPLSNTVNNNLSNNTNNNLNNTSHVTSHVTNNNTGGITEQQLKAVLSNLVNSRVVQVNLLLFSLFVMFFCDRRELSGLRIISLRNLMLFIRKCYISFTI